jgi:hypothetical protein
MSDVVTRPAHRLAIPEIKTLRELRRVLAHGGLPAPPKRTSVDCARIASFRTLEELCRLLDEFRRRVEAGERCRLVEREHGTESGRMLIEIAIEVAP